jgi:CRP-like cAMP-binding protein
MRVEYHKKDKIIIREDEKTRDLYIIEHGECEVLKNDEVIATLGKNEVFGELGWLENLPRSATVKASTDCTLKVIPANEASKFITQNPSALMPLLRVVCHRLQNTLQFINKIQ